MKFYVNYIMLILLFLTVNPLKPYSQKVTYFKDFDYYKMEGVSVLNTINILPDFYIKCLYDKDGNIIEISAIDKLTWQHVYTTNNISVINQLDRKLLFLGADKTRTGYTRTIFQKKIHISDSALLIKDTLIYKLTRKDHIDLQFYTKINTDSIKFMEMNFSFNNENKLCASPIISFARYKEWFSLNKEAYRIIAGTIKLKENPILIRSIIKSNGFVNILKITKNDLKDMREMPVSFFWLKNSGLLN